MTQKPISWVPVFNGVVATDPLKRDAQEAAAKARLLSLLDEPHRTFVKSRLESSDPDTRTSISGIPGNPAAAAVLAEIYAIANARHNESYLTQQRELATLMSAPVLIALWQPSKSVEYRATVVRTTRGQNIILLQEEEAMADRLAQALRIVARSRLREGEFPQNQVRRYAQGIPPMASAAEKSVVLSVIAQLRSAERREVEGYGNLQAVTVTVGPVPRPSSLKE